MIMRMISFSCGNIDNETLNSVVFFFSLSSGILGRRCMRHILQKHPELTASVLQIDINNTPAVAVVSS